MAKIDVDKGAAGIHKVEVNLPSNSKTKKIIKGRVITKKKTLGQKVKEVFVGEDVDNVFSYILHDVIIPATKGALVDAVQSGIEMFLYGEKRGRDYNRTGRSNINYSGISNFGRSAYKNNTHRPEPRRTSRNSEEIIFQTRGDAESVLNNLVDLIKDYGQSSVNDLYDMVGKTGDFTDDRYGWTDLSSSRIRAVRGGYIIEFPRTEVL
jgi:hypothetical protein